jgi:crotonobetainyl-CoA:carnitine CoA-transferase CaiB-like acyl-CoA transferase
MAGPLADLRVIDFGQYIAGPLAAVMLGDQGADVIHVDPPGGPRFDGPADAFLNRGKRRIILDLKTPEGQRAAQRLVETADVVIENFRPGVMDRLGLGKAAMTAANPRLIYCSLPGFGEGDPRAGMRAWEGVLQAATANTIPRTGEEPEGWDWTRPTYSALPLPSSFGGYLGATSIVMALIARERTGRGQIVDVPLYDAMFTLIGHNGTYRNESGPRPPAPIHPRGSGCFRCKDGRYVQFDTSSPRHLTWFARLAGITETWPPEILDLLESAKPEVNAELHKHFRELFLTRTAEEWEAIGNEAGTAIGFVRTPQEWLATDHAKAIGASVQIDDPVIGTMTMAGAPVYLSDTVAGTPSPRHLPGADTAEVLAELETLTVPEAVVGPEPDIEHPLSGMKVIDLGVALAGPTCGRLLLEYGADVIKISAPDNGVSAYLNRGKRSILLDVGKLQGQGVYWKLVEESDVILENMSPTTMDRLGIGYHEVKARRPDAVYTSISCYGRTGPWTGFRGWERQGQAVSGMMERTALPSVLGPYNPVDIGTGVLGTFATGLALFHKVRTGEGQMAGASLCQTGMYHQAIYSFDFPGYVPTEPRGYEALGEGSLDRFYKGSDRWFYLASNRDELGQLSEVVGNDLSAFDGAELEKTLDHLFADETAEVWVDRLVSAGISAHVNETVEDLMVAEVPIARGLSVTQDVEGAGLCTMPGISVHLSDTPGLVGAAPRQPGINAAEILEELGLADRLAALEQSWVVRTTNLAPAWPAH